MQIHYLEIVTPDVEAAVASVVHAGGTVAVPPMKIPAHGTFAISLQGGIDHGLWQRETHASARGAA